MPVSSGPRAAAAASRFISATSSCCVRHAGSSSRACHRRASCARCAGRGAVPENAFAARTACRSRRRGRRRRGAALADLTMVSTYSACGRGIRRSLMFSIIEGNRRRPRRAMDSNAPKPFEMVADEASFRLRAYRERGPLNVRLRNLELLHATGHLMEAEAVYRDGLDRCGTDATLLFNLGVLLEDARRGDEADRSCRAALSARSRRGGRALWPAALICEDPLAY